MEEQTGVNGFLDFAARFFQCFSNLTGFEGDKSVFVFHQQPAHVSNNLSSGRGGRCCPRWKGVVCGLQCSVNVGFGGKGKLPQHVSEVSGVRGLERGTVACGHQLSVDDIVPFDSGLSGWVRVGEVLKTGFKDVNHGEPIFGGHFNVLAKWLGGQRGDLCWSQVCSRLQLADRANEAFIYRESEANLRGRVCQTKTTPLRSECQKQYPPMWVTVVHEFRPRWAWI